MSDIADASLPACVNVYAVFRIQTRPPGDSARASMSAQAASRASQRKHTPRAYTRARIWQHIPNAH
eukprot:14057271-Alexandrium_andersonii.AAC.1